MPSKRRRSKLTPENNREEKRRATVSTNEKLNNKQSNAQNSQTMNTNGNNGQYTPNQHTNYVQYANGQNFASPQLPSAQAANTNGQVGTPYATPTYNSPPQYTNLTGNDPFSVILSRLDGIEKKLSQLDGIEKSVMTINSRLDKLDSKVTNLDTKIMELEKSREFDSTNITEIKNKQKEIDNLVEKMKNMEQKQRDQNDKMQKELIDLKSRSMRDNLLFFGIPEEKGEIDNDCVNKVLSFIEEKCEIEHAKTDIKLHRAHRIGRFKKDKIRPIVAKFVYYPDRERVRRSTENLSRPYGISQQFPHEIVQTRKRLYPVLKKARDDQKDAYFVMDRLYIDGSLYREPTTQEENQ